MKRRKPDRITEIKLKRMSEDAEDAEALGREAIQSSQADAKALIAEVRRLRELIVNATDFIDQLRSLSAECTAILTEGE